MSILVAPYDGTSRVPGVSFGASRLEAALRELGAISHSVRAIRERTKNSALYCRRLLAAVENEPCRLLLGGEHLVTFPVLEVLVRKHRDLRLVVLDAHHDAYDFPLLTHYSLFHFVATELAIPTLIVGARHELDQASGCEVMSMSEVHAAGIARTLDRIRAFAGTHPLYFSVDVDVLDPATFPAVSDRVPGGLSVEELTELTHHMLALSPVAVDIVEYNPFLDPDGNCLSALTPFLKEYATWLGRRPSGGSSSTGSTAVRS